MSKTVSQLRREGMFVCFIPLPRTGNKQKDRSILLRQIESHIDNYLSGIRKPAQRNFDSPQSY